MSPMKTFLSAACAVVCAVACAEPYVVKSGETLKVTDATTYADGIVFEDATGVVEFDTAGSPAMDISGAGTVIKTKTGWWAMTKTQPNFSGDYILRGGGMVELGSDLGQDRRYYFGNETGTLYIEANNGLEVPNSGTTDVKLFGNKRVVAAGVGSGSYGGFIRTLGGGSNKSGEFLNSLSLSNNATINLQGHFDLFVGNGGRFDLNGYTLTSGGEKGSIVFTSPFTIGASGSLCYRSSNNYFGSYKFCDGVTVEKSSDPFVIENYGGFCFYYTDASPHGAYPIRRPLVVRGSCTHFIGIQHDESETTPFDAPQTYTNPDVNAWEGPITIESGSTLDFRVSLPDQQFVAKGAISGPGSVSVGEGIGHAKKHRGRVYFANTNNTYEGNTVVNNCYDYGTKSYGQVLYAGPHSIPDFSKFSADYGVVGLQMKERESADEVLWTDGTYIRDLAEQGTFTPAVSGNSHMECTIGLDASLCGGDFTMNMIDGMSDFPVWIGGTGPGRIIMTNVVGTAAHPIRLHHRGGELVIRTAPGKQYLGEIRVNSPSGGTTNSVVTFEGCDLVVPTLSSNLCFNAGYMGSSEGLGATVRLRNTRLVNENFNFSTANYKTDVIHPGGYVGYGSTDCGCMDICEGTVITGRLVVGGIAYGAGGAVFQYGGKVAALGRADTYAEYSSQIGGGGLASGGNNGYYEMRGGEFTALGSMAIGMYEGGYLAQYGGTFRVARALGATTGTPVFYVGSGNSQAQAFAMRISGGVFDIGPGQLGINAGWASGNQHALVTVENTGYLNAGTEVFRCNQIANAQSRFTLANGGRMRLRGFAKNPDTGSATYESKNELSVNFNGGIMECAVDGWQGGYGSIPIGDVFCLYRNSTAYHPASAYVYEGGATIDTAGKTGLGTFEPISCPTGKGITGLVDFEPFACAFEPVVRVYGDGKGAVAIAEWSRDTQMVTGIRIVAPGVDYTTATVKFCWGRSAEHETVCTLGESATTGGFTKTGEGDFFLGAKNTWGGATVVRGGSLTAQCDWAIPAKTAVVLAGGNIDYNHMYGSVSSVTYGVGTGEILNAENVTMSDAVNYSISTEELAAGKSIAFSGDVDLSKVTVIVTGDAALLDEAKRYRLVTTDGTFSGEPAKSFDPSLKRWSLAVDPHVITISVTRGVLLLVR